MNNIQLSPDQRYAAETIRAWLSTPEKRLSLGGFAGTGKTTIISHLLQELNTSVAVCAFTGKAASVLRSKGVTSATTMHKLMYVPEKVCGKCLAKNAAIKTFDGKWRCKVCGSLNLRMHWTRVPVIGADLVIVDEASMLNLSLVEDIEELAQKILYVGDHGQLEPIGKDPGIMREPDIRLEQIHRQAEASGIIQLAHHMRQGFMPTKWYGSEFDDARVVGLSKLVPQTLRKFDMILCGYNKTRKVINKIIRDDTGLSGDGELPTVGDRLICLQNDSDLGLFNGLLVTIVNKHTSYEYPKYSFRDDFGNEYDRVSINPEQFSEEKKIEYSPKGIGLFDYGYCLTTHKSQGSEWDKVAVIEQLARSWDPARWRYTAATRAAKYLEYWMPTSRAI